MRKTTKAIAMILAAVLSLTACAGGNSAGSNSSVADGSSTSTTGTDGKTGGMLRYGLSSEPAQLEPVLAQGTAKRCVLETMYRGLMTYTPEGKLTNALAEDYTISDDNLTYTFKLRDAKFHNGDAVTAEDVVFSIERMLDPNNGASFRQELSVIDSITAVDEKTVQIKLKEVCAPFLHLLALPESCIVSKSYTESKGNNLDTEPMGCGPFKFKEWNKGQDIIVERFDDYYGEGPYVDSIEFKFYSDDDARVNAIKTGEVDVIDYVPWKEMAAMKNDSSIILDSQNGPVMNMGFNLERCEPLKDARVRRAIAYAVNRENVTNMAFYGASTVCDGFIFEDGFLGYNEKQKGVFRYDPEYAKQLLAEAGYPDGFSCTLLASSQYSMHEQTAVAIQDALKQIGIDCTLDLPDWPTRMDKVGNHDYDIYINAMSGDYADPDWLSNFFSGGQYTYNKSYGYNNPEVDSLLSEARSTLDVNKRQESYEQLIDILLEDCPQVFLCWRQQTSACASNVTGFVQYPGYLANSMVGMTLGTVRFTS